jgi:thiamine-phosphate pyrophosphorylase
MMESKVFEWSRREKALYCFADSLPLCRRLLDAGARIIQLRAKTMGDRAFRKLAQEMQEMIAGYPAPALFVVNDRVDVAFQIGADGLHLGQEDAEYRQVIQNAPKGMTIGVSVDTVAEAMEAQEAGATYVGAGSVFPTTTKSDARLMGLAELERIVAATRIPVVAIGGIGLGNIGQVVRAGAHYFAVISEINTASDLESRIHAFEQKIQIGPHKEQRGLL